MTCGQFLFFKCYWELSKMQDNTGDTLDLNKRQMHNGIYDMALPPDGEVWNQLHEQGNDMLIIYASHKQCSIWSNVYKLRGKVSCTPE